MKCRIAAVKCRITEVHQLQVRGSLFQPTRTLIKKLLEITDFMSVVLQLQPTTQSSRIGISSARKGRAGSVEIKAPPT